MKTKIYQKVGDAFLSDDSPLWAEYDSAAGYCAKRGWTGDIGTPLPANMSHQVVFEINYDVDAFKERVRQSAYALAMGKASG